MLNKIQGEHPLIQPGKTVVNSGAPFRVGEVFLGQVLERHGETQVTVAAKGARFRAYTTLPLVPGTRYRFFVQQERPQLMLQALDLDTSMSARLLRLWRFHAAARASFAGLMQKLSSAAKDFVGKGQAEVALQRLSDLLPGMVNGGIDSLNPHWLARQLSGWGLFWESKVARWLAREGAGRAAALVAADLKGALLALQENLDLPTTGAPRQSLEALVAQALEFVELQQQLNLLSGPELGQWFWFIPGAEQQGLQSVEIFIEEEAEETESPGKGGIIRLILRLELSRLGPMEATIGLGQEKISCQLRVSDEPLARWISSKLPELNVALEGRGFRVTFLGCEAGAIQQTPPFLMNHQGTGPSLLHLIV